jgi:hypothetical protein
VEYAEKWAYLRHIEGLRLSFAQWFTLSGTDSLADQTRRFERTSILGFLVIYSLLLQLFMWAQKNLLQPVCRTYPRNRECSR